MDSIPLPAPLPSIEGDFDWRVRDYDGFRLFMLEELAARFVERNRWTPADVEVALVEVLAYGLDQLSDRLDRVAAEAALATARRPDTVRRLLRLIGYDAVEIAKARGQPPFDAAPREEDRRLEAERLDAYWLNRPEAMEAARREGPRAILTQRRFVTLEDYAQGLEDHPLVRHARADQRWGGSWPVIRVAVILAAGQRLDQPVGEALRQPLERFNARRGLRRFESSPLPTVRTVLRDYLEHYRLAGQEVVLTEGTSPSQVMAGPSIVAISLRVDRTYRREEVEAVATQTLTQGPRALFGAGSPAFGGEFFGGDIIQALMAIDGVRNVTVEVLPQGSVTPSHGAFHLRSTGGRKT